MEHLIYDPDPRTLRAEVRAAATANLQVLDWSQYDQTYGNCSPTLPATRWLGHEHAGSSAYHSRRIEVPLDTTEAFQELYGRGWSLERVFITGDVREAHPSFRTSSAADEDELAHRAAAFLQSWVYFGLLEAVIARPISTSYLVRANEDGELMIYSRNLPVLLLVWLKQLNALPANVKEGKLREARECASTAHGYLLHFLETPAENGKTDAIQHLETLVWLIEPALSALSEAIIRFTEAELGSEVQLVNSKIVGSPDLHLQRLIDRGWCPFALANAEIALPSSFLRCVDLIALHSSSKGHEACTRSRCERNHVRTETYTQQHWPRKCRCCFVHPELNTIQAILDADMIPILQWDEANNTFTYSSDHPDASTADYVAFSHVWADGLGSDTERGLPQCQVRRLSQLAAGRIASPSWFWIDALCVPRSKHHRRKAITRMKATYANATGVVALDEGFLAVSEEHSILEIGFAVVSSGWFGRLWTYQEAFLPPWVDLAVRDGFVDLETLGRDLYRVWARRVGNPFPAVFVRDVFTMLQKVRPLGREGRERPVRKRIVNLFNALARRETSRVDDQLIVIAPLLDVEIEECDGLDGEERWRKFYLALGVIPWTILFDRRPKMGTHGFGWAPATWLSAGRDEWLHYDDGLAQISEHGLVVDMSVLVLREPRAVAFSALYVSAGDVVYRISREGSGELSQCDVFEYVVVRHFDNRSPEVHLRDEDSGYVVVAHPLPEDRMRSMVEWDYLIDGRMELLSPADVASLGDGVHVVDGEWQVRKLCFT